MTRYKIEAARPAAHTFFITLTFTATDSTTYLQMPYWRPGRYEGGNFSKNIVGLDVYAGGQPLPARKITSERWQVETRPDEEVTVTYRCYAASLTAGNTYLDEELLLINPVNCLIYVLGTEDSPSTLALEIPERWKAATSMPRINNGASRHYRCSDLQELLDTPILAAPEIETIMYSEGGTDFYIDIYGKPIPDREKLKNDFIGFTRAQIAAFGEFPVREYHFLTLLLPHKAYHGVEHESSTVIIAGPSTDLGNWNLYKELIGISSHELYHTWNVKNLRPADWTPYNFTGPGYSRLGYVAEGVTTYMGDWMLWQSGFFNDEAFLAELATHIQRHMDNEGRFNLSLADSSVDTWVDGYGLTTPRRRVSIYVEGALLALVCDIFLLKSGKGKSGLSDVMQTLYQKFGQKRGFSESDYWKVFEEAAPTADWNKLRSDVVDGRGKLMEYVRTALSEMHLDITAAPAPNSWEAQWGMRCAQINGVWEIITVLSESPAEKSGLWFGDKILAIGEMTPDEFLSDPQRNLSDVVVKVQAGFREKYCTPHADGRIWLKKYGLVRDHDSDDKLFKQWRKLIRKTMESFRTV